MNNPDEQLPCLLTSATAPASAPANFGRRFSDDLNHGRNFSKLKVGPTKPRLGKKFNASSGSGDVKVPCICSECGKRFGSWKALFGHMRCHPERQWRGMVPPPNIRPDGVPYPVVLPSSVPDPWLTMTEEDYEVAEGLLMLANSAPNLACMEEIHHPVHGDVELIGYTSGPAGQFECSSCKKVFGSHQALGGHRASHKNVKGCFALNTDFGDKARTPSLTQPVNNSSCVDPNLDLNLRLGL